MRFSNWTTVTANYSHGKIWNPFKNLKNFYIIICSICKWWIKVVQHFLDVGHIGHSPLILLLQFHCSTWSRLIFIAAHCALECSTLLTTNFAFAVSVLHMLKVNWILYCCCCQSWLIFGKWFSTNECEVRIAFSNFYWLFRFLSLVCDLMLRKLLVDNPHVLVTFWTQVLAFSIFVMFVVLILPHSHLWCLWNLLCNTHSTLAVTWSVCKAPAILLTMTDKYAASYMVFIQGEATMYPILYYYGGLLLLAT